MAPSRIPLVLRPLVAGVFALAGCWAPTAGMLPATVPAPVGDLTLPADPNAPRPAPAPIPRPAGWSGEVPAALSGAGRLDWTVDRFSGARVVAARKAANLARANDPAARKLLAFGDNTGWAGGIALTDPAFGVTGVAASGPAYAYRGSAKMGYRVWFVTTTGWLLGVKVDDPKNLTANANNVPIAINLGRPVSNGYVTLSDDGERAYVVSDNGRILMADLDPGTVVADLPIDPASPTGASLGMAAFMDPLLTNPSSGTQDVLFTANNAGKVAKFTWNGTTFAAAGLQTGVNISSATDGSSTNLLKATPVALGGILYYGDRGGNLNVMDFDAGYSASNPSTTFLGSAWPVEAPVALDLDASLVPSHVFLAVGPESAWVDITTPSSPVISTSPVLAIDSNVGAAPASTAGVVSAFPYQGVSITPASAAALTNPVQAATALTPNTPPGTGMTLMNGDIVATFLQSYRTASLGGSQIIDQNLPTCQTVYGTTNTSANTTNYSYAHQGQPAASRTRFSTPIDVAFGPYGEAYTGGKTNNNATMVKMVASQTMAPAWGYSAATLSANQAGVNTFMGNRTYIVAGAGSPVGAPTPAFNEPHAVFYDNNNTAGSDADDSLWVADWAGNKVRRIMRATGAVVQIAGFAGAYPNGSLNGPHGICRAWGATGAPVYFSQYSNRNIVKYDPGTGVNTLVSFIYGGGPTTTLPGIDNTNLCYLNGPNDGAQGSLYIPSRGSHVIQRYDIATNTLTIHCGTLGSNVGAPSADGTLRAAARLNGPEAVTGNPLNGDLYIGENAGRRVKVIYGSGASAGRLYTLAGNGGAVYSGDGQAGPSVSLGWVSGLRLGPPDLTQPATNPYGALYMDSRDTHTIIRFDFPLATAAFTKGLMRWDYSAYANRNFIRASVDMTVHTAVPATTGGNPTTVPRPDLVLASKTHPAGATPWTTAGLTPATVPSHNPTIKAIYPAASATTAQAFAVDQTMTYRLPAGSLPNDGQLSLALVPPAGNGYAYHYGWGQNVAWTPTDRETVDVHGIAGTSPAAKRPRLTGILSTYKFQNPILSPPTIYNDGSVRYVFVANTNALFRLNYSSVATWTSDAAYTATRLGRTTNGPIDTTVAAPYHFIANPTPPTATWTGKIYLMDRKILGGGNYNFSLNKFDGLGVTSPTYTAPPANCQIDNQVVSGGLSTGTYFVMDNFGGDDAGFAYFGLGNGRIYRLGI